MRSRFRPLFALAWLTDSRVPARSECVDVNNSTLPLFDCQIVCLFFHQFPVGKRTDKSQGEAKK